MNILKLELFSANLTLAYMNLLGSFYSKQTIRTLSFVFLASFLLNVSAHAQGSTPPPEYFKNVETGDSLSNQNNYREAITYYLKAFQAFDWRGTPDDRYKLARAWGYTANKDSLVTSLERLCSRSRYWNYQRFIDDPAFKSLKNTPKSDELVSCFKANKEKYFPQINVEFYNALDSIYQSNMMLQKKEVMVSLVNGNSPIITEQKSKKYLADLQRVTQLLDKYGWPDAAAVEFYGNNTLFEIIKVSPRKGYEKYRNMMYEASLKTNPSLNISLVTALDTILSDDQQDRVNMNTVRQMYGTRSKQLDSLAARMTYYDSVNLVKVTRIIDTYGWPGPDIAGSEGATAVFLVIQHADLATQEKYLPVLREAVKKGKAKASSLALLEDRVLVRNGKPQIYGSQLREINSTGKYEFYPIEDAPNVNKRRAAVGLQSLEDYAKLMGLSYDMSK